jgi:hypothetical protein
MTYRQMGVAGRTYQYSVGRDNVHIKGGTLTKPLNFKREDVGLEVVWRCACCDQPISSARAVTPQVIKNLITTHLKLTMSV